MSYEEYRAEALTKLGADFELEDLRNEERWRLKVLEALDNYSGGGSSDLSTAKVTFNFSEQKPDIDYPKTIYIQPNLDLIVYADVMPPLGTQYTTLDVVCWKNKCEIEYITDASYISSSGSCEYDSDEGVIYVTGDCTITLYRPSSI